MSIERFCRKEVAVVHCRDSIARAAREMRDRHVGALVVVDDDRRPLGMITDRDITCRVVASSLDAGATTVESRSPFEVDGSGSASKIYLFL